MCTVKNVPLEGDSDTIRSDLMGKISFKRHDGLLASALSERTAVDGEMPHHCRRRRSFKELVR